MCIVNSLYHWNNARVTSDFDVLLSFIARFSRGEIPFNELTQHEAIFYKTSGNNKLAHTQGKHNHDNKRTFKRGLAAIASTLF
jgi:hypothetical protein